MNGRLGQRLRTRSKPCASAKRKTPGRARPSRRAARRRPALSTRTFRDGSAVILDQSGGIIGLIEARAPYRVKRR